MTLFWASFTYLITYCITLFTLLPVQRLNFRQKLLWNAVLAAGVTLAIHLLLSSNWVDLRNAY